eukprot:jgi/Ulvmu1/2225/UM013_0072.1
MLEEEGREQLKGLCQWSVADEQPCKSKYLDVASPEMLVGRAATEDRNREMTWSDFHAVLVKASGFWLNQTKDCLKADKGLCKRTAKFPMRLLWQPKFKRELLCAIQSNEGQQRQAIASVLSQTLPANL